MPPTVLDHLELDHERIRTLLDRARDASPERRAGATRALVDALVRHETAEAALVRPWTRGTRDGYAIARVLDDQERTISRLVAALETTDPVDEQAFREVLGRLRAAVVQHVAAEEHTEHPRLRGECNEQQLVDLGRRFVRVTSLDLPDAASAGDADVNTPAVFARAREVVRLALLT